LTRLGYSKRGPLSAVKDLFPDVIITEGTTEDDDLWAKTGGNESEEEVGERVESAFEKVWDMAKYDDCLSFSLITKNKLISRYRHCLPQGDIQYPLAQSL
jgi:hypothetical protein